MMKLFSTIGDQTMINTARCERGLGFTNEGSCGLFRGQYWPFVESTTRVVMAHSRLRLHFFFVLREWYTDTTISKIYAV